LVLGARSVGKLEQVKKDLVVKFPKLDVVIGALDVADPKSQEAFWKVVKEKEGRARPVMKERRRVSAAEVWKVLRPGNGFWDSKVEYEAIGKGAGREWDEVYMLSSLNHHISILKLRVHPLYLQFLADGALPQDLPADASWASPILQRTRWYDFFVLEDRAEAMRGLWGIMAYLMRQKEKEKENEKEKEKEKGKDKEKEKEKDKQKEKEKEVDKEYKYVSVVRKKSERESLPSYECAQCRSFYEAVGNDGGPNLRKNLVNNCSRHRSRHPPSNTPADFWDIDFPGGNF